MLSSAMQRHARQIVSPLSRRRSRPCIRRLSSSSSASKATEKESIMMKDAQIHVRGETPYGSREYLLLPPHVGLDDVQHDESLKIASLMAHRNTIFGARSFHSSLNNSSKTCASLLSVALTDAAAQGEQPQAVSTLHGLCDWVAAYIDDNNNNNNNQTEHLNSNNMDSVTLEACRAMATGIPRPGHSVVGMGTYRDAESGWKDLAREFVRQNPSDECQLYLSVGRGYSCELVEIEYMASTEATYLQSAGGSMARFFFL